MPSTVAELLVEWDRRRREGTPVSIEELCADQLDDLTELQDRARRLEECDRLLGLTGPTATADDPVPDRIGVYEIRGVLGRGGMGVVYDGWDPGLKRAAAVKVLRPTTAYRPFVRPDELRARFIREREVLGQLEHDYLVQVYGSGVSGDDRPYIAMARLAGGSARDRAAELTQRGPRTVAAFVAKVARGVHAAHQLGVVHRDLKPANILLTATGEPRVSDFGLARFWSTDPPVDSEETWLNGRPPDSSAGDLTVPGVQPGTPAYMAPEQLEPARGRVGPTTDVWALGVVLFELISGTRPFAVGDDRPLSDQVCRSPTPPCRSLRGRVPRWLRQVVSRCLAKDPAARYPSAAALADALERGLRAGRRRAWLAGTVGALALVLAVGVMGGWLAWADSNGETRLEDLPEVKQSLADLAAGKEVVLVDGERVAPYRWVFGPESGRSVADDPRWLTLHTKSQGPAAVEFLPSLPAGRYRVRAEVRHQFGNSGHAKMILYVAGRHWESAAGRHLHCVALHYNDLGPSPTNTAPLKSLLTGVVRNSPEHWTGHEVGHVEFVPAAAAGREPDFRTLDLVVTEAGVEGWWEAQPAGLVTPRRAAVELQRALAGYPERQPAGSFPSDFRGGVGLIVCSGTMNVRSFRITPCN